MAIFRFKPRMIATGLPPAAYAQTALTDLDQDRQLAFISGHHFATVFY